VTKELASHSRRQSQQHNYDLRYAAEHRNGAEHVQADDDPVDVIEEEVEHLTSA
jgi:hypothetical protein